MSFTHLHVHSEYSLLDGLIKIDNLVARAKEFKMKSLALTDHGAMYGAFKFYIACRDVGIKPIVGVEAYKAKNSRFDRPTGVARDQFHLTLLSKNYTGYQNLMKLTTYAHLEGYYYKPRVDFELLEKYREGIIVLSGCLNSELSQAILYDQTTEAEKLIRKYIDLYAENFYFELQRPFGVEEQEKVNQALILYSRQYGVPIVATADVHYLEKGDAYAQEILLCIQTQRTILEKDRPLTMYETPEYYFRTPSEMKGLFVDLPECIENSEKIADLCNLEIPYGRMIFPNYPIPGHKTADVYFRELTAKNTLKRYSRVTPELRKRIDYELDVICKKGYSTYFLIVADFVNWAKSHNVAVGPGRGSVAGSCVAYILNITDINPLDYNLPFERFLNPDRPSPPDIDIDFADTRRDAVLDYVVKKYGKEKVAQIITFGRMEARLAVRDTARALGYSYSEGDRLAKMIPQGKQGFAVTIQNALEESPELKSAHDSEEDTKRILDIAEKLEGVARHSSVHAAGVVIADRDLTDYVPLQKEAKGDRIITQFDMYSLDLNAVSENKAVGLMKMDFLGLRNLTIIEQAIEFVKKTTGKTVSIYEAPIDDKRTFNLISRGKTVGVFQLESRGMRRLAQDLRPERMSDLMAMVALYRPGPMELIPVFIEGKRNPKKIKYLHSDLEPVLSETYGVMVYQEQIMDIAHKLAGYTMSEADILRMAVGKKKKKMMVEEHKKFVERFESRGYTKELAEQIFAFIEKFAAYGFNKPHSASYALIAYWTAYMKANYTIEYMTALLTAELQGVAGAQKEAKVFSAIEECRDLKIDILPPSINKSKYGFSIENGAIRFGLSAVKNVGEAAIESILEGREEDSYKSLRDFLQRVDLRRVNRKTVESLIKAGAMDKFGARSALLLYYPSALTEVQKTKISTAKGQFGLFGDSNQNNNLIDNLPNTDEFDDGYLADLEKEVIGFSLKRSTMSKYKTIIEKKITKKIGEIMENDEGKKCIIAGTISTIKIVKTKKDNHDMIFVTIYDETGSIESVVFPKTYTRTLSAWKENEVVLAKGTISQKERGLSFIIDEVVNLTQRDKR
ncbi:DNA polymerase III subunit alpha [Candidatus Roizmanbacteria bacterium RIFCSPHIGHO2_01_FULL_39_12b]|uniref:DNA polymerase III subunit alpha n=1 Tax=Candidatus Roizmanbacteria bacterium RIFCSPHIGHO2_01_FULL_39_12b TaxID=1802030 RepID=A0A1F7GAY0_9BACT|nr:MAG: DNA polymerase III subunit alpha [Candidatus Roizmanbacteria bacterium RIFCSPHIGHO2_01_FULL_39_12b]OGK46091.1 MAG: DNA polymerase III subunit alpha [Candidatus Roizmanbacteria bacterium RIFCSPLOWO2_01_FULL_39_19]